MKLFVNASHVVTCAGPARARRGSEMRDAGVREGAAVAVDAGRVTAVAPDAELRARFPDAELLDCRRGVLTPGLVDSHTHGVFGAARYTEQELRASGLDYLEIARRGGGIHSSVRSLRGFGEDDLVALTRARLMRLAAFGATTIEVKSGYGLSLEHELASLRVIARVASQVAMRLVPTFLGAHEIPLEFREREGGRGRGEYVELLVHEMIPSVARAGLARFADVFCETGVFSVAESRTILEAARQHGLALKLHADELTSSGGAELAASLGAVSADHLAAISDAGIAALSHANTVATLLPGTMLFLGKTGQAPARRLVDAGIPVALATDFNPGTSPTPNLPLILALGVSQLHLTAAEAVVAATANGAAALALADAVGQIAPGFSADLALFEMTDFRELPYWYGDNRCLGTWVKGEPCHVVQSL